ncbi:hypothetical protein LDENG_00183640 [Lucifuga dentata]|nr:hypothetical protein LDENG_00183640 [Lucifuga dentata]
MVAKRKKVVRTEGVELPEGRIADIQDSYKYLGIPQTNGESSAMMRRQGGQPQPNTSRD